MPGHGCRQDDRIPAVPRRLCQGAFRRRAMEARPSPESADVRQRADNDQRSAHATITTGQRNLCRDLWRPQAGSLMCRGAFTNQIRNGPPTEPIVVLRALLRSPSFRWAFFSRSRASLHASRGHRRTRTGDCNRSVERSLRTLFGTDWAPNVQAFSAASVPQRAMTMHVRHIL